MSRAVRLTLPFPPSGLSPNARLGWRKKAQLTAEYRESCGWLAVKARDEAMAEWEAGRRDKRPLSLGLHQDAKREPVEATVTFVVPDRRKRDEDNLLAMLKPAWDGLTDAGVLVGDDHANFKVGKVSIEVAGRPCGEFRYTDPCVIVDLVSVGAGP